MRFSFNCIFFISVLFFGCNNETKLSGLVVDRVTKQPLSKVNVRTIKGADGTQLEFAETRSESDGRFTLVFSGRQVNANKLLVEVSKEGYITNMFPVFQDRPNDTIFLERQY